MNGDVDEDVDLEVNIRERRRSLASVWLLENDRSIMVFFPSGIGISSYWSLLMEIGVQFPLS